MDLFDAATRARMADPKPRIFTVAQLDPSTFGVIDVEVRTVQPVKTFQRKTGGEGQLRRVTLADHTGEVDLVLWGNDVGAINNEFVQGRRIRMRGPTVKAGWQGGVELAWDGCIIEDAPDSPKLETFRGTLVELGPTRIIGEPPAVRFQAEATLEGPKGTIQVILWDDAVKQLRQILPGGPVVLKGLAPHPSLDGWMLGEGAQLA